MEDIAKGLKKKYKIDYAWKGDRMQFRRTGAAGYLDLGDGFIELNIKLGMVLVPLKGKIEKTIRQDHSIGDGGQAGKQAQLRTARQHQTQA